ncbi:transposase [Streptomyces wuyuanensis]
MPAKTNEITCFAALLTPLDLRGVVVTADALHTQTGHVRFLVEQKRVHFVLLVKANQPALCAALRSLPWKEVTARRYDRETGHGPAIWPPSATSRSTRSGTPETATLPPDSARRPTNSSPAPSSSWASADLYTHMITVTLNQPCSRPTVGLREITTTKDDGLRHVSELTRLYKP